MHTHRRAFTLIELLVVMAIIALLAGLVFVGFRLTQGQVNGAAARVQSALAGARDRVIHAAARNPQAGVTPSHGVRFFVDPQMPGAVRTMQFVERPPAYTSGSLMIERPDLNPPDGIADVDELRYVRLVNPSTGLSWSSLKLIGALTTGCRIRIPNTGNWYAVDDTLLGIGNERLGLKIEYQGDRTGIAAMDAVEALAVETYVLELNPSLSPNSQPMNLPDGAVLDLNRSAGIPPHTTHFDIMFSPRGGVVGPAAAMGMIHFYLADTRDATMSLNPAVAEHDMRAVTLRTGVGSAEVHPVDITDANADGIADDPFRLGSR